jgi:hypothetical protein
MQTPGLAGHSESEAHARQVFAVVLQIGLVATVQSPFPTQATQAPVDAQAGVVALTLAHSVVPLPHARQVFVVVSQIGFVPALQSESATHSTHAPDAAQTSVPASAPPQSPVFVHARHFFVVESQTGVTPLHEAAVQPIPAPPPLPE